VLTGVCSECRVHGAAPEPGAPLAIGDSLSVPRGAKVTFGFALPGKLVDPTVGVDLEGPAVANAPDDKTIALTRGTGRFRGLREVTLVVPGGRVAGDGATFTVRIDEHGIARVAVEKGHVLVSSAKTDSPQDLVTGGVVELGGEPAESPAAARLSASPAPLPSPSAEPKAPTETAGRPAFTRAATDLGSTNLTERQKARARLYELLRDPDATLAWDAASLLARTESSPSGRAAVWARYLAGSPPSFYRNRAMLERAEALLAAGQTNEVHAILVELRSASLSDSQRLQLERISSDARPPR
jgi:hypothetical protein